MIEYCGVSLLKIGKKRKNPELYKAILQLQSEEECYAFFEDLCTISELRSMEQRYQVASLLGVSVGHLSSSFKRQTGKNFMDYVTEYKVERAKELMDSGNGYMVYEIADMLGFDTPFYFSRVFKKVTGLSPRDYETMRAAGKRTE